MAVLALLAAGFGMVAVDRAGSQREAELWRRADRLADRSDFDLMYEAGITMHHLAAVYDAPSCSAIVVRTTQRFLPAGVAFDADDVRRIDAGEELPSIRLVMKGEPTPATFEC